MDLYYLRSMTDQDNDELKEVIMVLKRKGFINEIGPGMFIRKKCGPSGKLMFNVFKIY